MSILINLSEWSYR